MLMKRICALSICVMSVLCSDALEVSVEAGGLHALICNPSGVKDLVLSGSIDASDFFYIERCMPELTSLDLSGVAIKEYNGSSLGGRTHYDGSMIPAAVFAGSALRSVVLPQGCTVGDFAFAGSSIEELTLPAGVAVGCGAFSRCTALASVLVSGSATLSRGAFEACSNLASVDGSEWLENIPQRAFDGCSSLRKFTFGSALHSIGEGAFSASGMVEADMSACSVLDSIGAWAFAGNFDLVSVTLPAAVRYVGDGAFFECTSLKKVPLSAGMTSISGFAFKDVGSAAGTLDIPEGIASIGPFALMGGGASEVRLPSSLESIGTGAMESMSSLGYIDATALSSVPAVGDDVWAGVEQGRVVLSVDPVLHEEYASTPQWCDFDIQSTSTTVAAVEDVKNIRAAFDGYIMIVESIGADIASVNVHDVSGRMLVSVDGHGSARISADTSAFTGPVFIIECILSDGTCGKVKILR